MDLRGLGRRVLPALLVVALTAVAGCGADDAGTTAEEATTPTSSSAEPTETEATTSPAPADAPECSEVWSAGRNIPRGYRGCADESGAFVEREGLACSSGQRMVTYADRFYGVIGGTVREAAAGSLDDDRDYRKAIRSCRA